jgi:hypothetical protein
VELREAADGIDDLTVANPETLVLGSSHGRTFHVLGQQLQKSANPGTPLVAVPLENGKLIPYAWLLENRIVPLLDERGPDGRLVRSRLKRFILLTEWWDSCEHEDRVHWNIPSRAWSIRHYFSDLLNTGVTSYNRNFLQYRVRRLVPVSVLIRDRYDPRVKNAVYRILRRDPVQRERTNYEARISRWQMDLEKGSECIGAPEQMDALNRIMETVNSRGLEMTIVLFPRMPSTMTDLAKGTTLRAFREMVEASAAPRGIQVIDLTWSSPLEDSDFMDDFDHVTAIGNLKFAAWALENHLSFLRND